MSEYTQARIYNLSDDIIAVSLTQKIWLIPADAILLNLFRGWAISGGGRFRSDLTYTTLDATSNYPGI